MKIEVMELFKIENYTVRLLDMDDIDDVQQLCMRCDDYFHIVEGMPPSEDAAQEILESLPPGKYKEDKFVAGIFNKDGRLAALADIVLDYPSMGTWILGLLLIDPGERNKGLGRSIHGGIMRWAATSGAKKLRIGVAEDNINALRFWTHLGYMEKDRVARRYGIKDNIVLVMEYKP